MIPSELVLPAAMLIIAFISGLLAWISKNVWLDKQRTQTFAMLAILSTIVLMGWVFFYSGL